MYMTMSPHEQDSNFRNGRGGDGARVGGTGMTGPWNAQGPATGGASRRRSGRLPAEALVCNIGLVLDISVGGMRVLARSNYSGTVKIKFRDYPTTEPLHATVTWTKRVGFFMREVGLRFENVSPQMSSLLTTIASCHRYRRVI